MKIYFENINNIINWSISLIDQCHSFKKNFYIKAEDFYCSELIIWTSWFKKESKIIFLETKYFLNSNHILYFFVLLNL
jgi:hypothetical protein